MSNNNIPNKNDIVTVRLRTWGTRKQSDCKGDIETTVSYPVLNGPECDPFMPGDKVRIVKTVDFGGKTWKALVKNDEDGRMIYLHDYEIAESGKT